MEKIIELLKLIDENSTQKNPAKKRSNQILIETFAKNELMLINKQLINK